MLAYTEIIHAAQTSDLSLITFQSSVTIALPSSAKKLLSLAGLVFESGRHLRVVRLPHCDATVLTI
jgi:hypothetical protein